MKVAKNILTALPAVRWETGAIVLLGTLLVQHFVGAEAWVGFGVFAASQVYNLVIGTLYAGQVHEQIANRKAMFEAQLEALANGEEGK